jgi:indole-3-glycerol phosphate synthase
MTRFSQAISEGDGISVVPVLGADVAELAAEADAAGAEALAVRTLEDAAAARGRTSLPILVRSLGIPGGGEGVDACVLSFASLVHHESELERVYADLVDGGFECVVAVRDEEELEQALERLDPEIILILEGEPEPEADELERTLDLLPDVPAGKLVIAEAGMLNREQVVALERAGVDAVLVAGPASAGEFAATLEELVRGSGSHS